MTKRATPDKPISDRVSAALDKATDFMTADEICKAVFGRSGTRERQRVYLALHRMEGVEKRAAGWRRKRK